MGKHEAPSKKGQGNRPQHSKHAVSRQINIDFFAVGAFFQGLAARILTDNEGNKRFQEKREYEFSLKNVGAVGAAALLFLIVWLLPTKGWFRFVTFLIPLALISIDTLRDAMVEIMAGDFFGRNFLISLVALGALCLGESRTAVFVMLLYRVGVMAEAYVLGEKRSFSEKWKERIPNLARLESENGVKECAPAEVNAGDTLIVEPGEKIPLDGLVVDGITSLDLSPLTGSTAPYNAGIGSPVYAGCVNLTNPIRVRVTDTCEASVMTRFLRVADRAEETRCSSNPVIQTLIRLLPPVVAVLGVLLAIFVPIFNGEWRTWIYRGLLLIAIAENGALLLSLPFAYSLGIGKAASNGIAVASVDALETLAKTETMVFSKTGTVMEGRYKVEEIFPERFSEKDLLTIAALSECRSQHPIARALREASGIGVPNREDIQLIEEIPGRGVSTLFTGRHVYVGNAALLMEHGIAFAVPSRTGTVIHVSVDNEYAGHIVLSDRVRDGAFDAIESLRVQGISSTVMLTGDVQSMARPVASSLNFDILKCELSTEAKISAVEYLKASKGNRAVLAYVSSKPQELELLERADVGVAFDALGSPKALETADITIMGDGISQIPLALSLAKTAASAVRQNLVAVLAVKALLLVLGLCGVMSIWLAVLIDTLMLALTSANVLRNR